MWPAHVENLTEPPTLLPSLVRHLYSTILAEFQYSFYSSPYSAHTAQVNSTLWSWSTVRIQHFLRAWSQPKPTPQHRATNTILHDNKFTSPLLGYLAWLQTYHFSQIFAGCDAASSLSYDRVGLFQQRNQQNSRVVAPIRLLLQQVHPSADGGHIQPIAGERSERGSTSSYVQTYLRRRTSSNCWASETG